MAKIKIKVTKLAYYNNQLVYPNEIIDYVGDVPSWGTLADGKATKKQEAPKAPASAPTAAPSEAPVAQGEKTEAQLQEELDALLDESVSKGIILEGAENKTIVEQIAELKVLLGK